MSADALRTAARLMRQTAELADPAPWTYDGQTLWSDGDISIAHTPHYECGEHIAAMDPTVALAVADWLDDIASRWCWDDGLVVDDDGNEITLEESMDSHALAVARVYLREES